MAQFQRLPPEIRYSIWKAALESPSQVIQININFQVAISTYYLSSRNKRIVFTGHFLSKKEEGIIWPPDSERLIHTISMVCTESRQVVLDMFPDLIRIEQPELLSLHEPPLAQRGADLMNVLRGINGGASGRNTDEFAAICASTTSALLK